MAIIRSVVNLTTGVDKVETVQPVRNGWLTGTPKTHIHAESVQRDVFGNCTVTEKGTGAKFELSRDQIKNIGGAVRTNRDKF